MVLEMVVEVCGWFGAFFWDGFGADDKVIGVQLVGFGRDGGPDVDAGAVAGGHGGCSWWSLVCAVSVLRY
jgi:hypothetical protein